jgi:hypothetical protein
LEWSSEETEIASEGCLSIPFVHVDVERPAEVRVRARDGYGVDLEVQGSGLTARVIQHEMDHLDGVLMIDRISRAERKEAMRAMREAQCQASEAPGADRATRDAGDAADADEEPDAGEAPTVPDADGAVPGVGAAPLAAGEAVPGRGSA